MLGKGDREVSIWRNKMGEMSCRKSQVKSLTPDTMSFLLDDWGPLPNSYRGH